MKDRTRLFTKACSDRTRGNEFKMKDSRFKLDTGGKNLYCEGGDALEQVVQVSCGCPIPGMFNIHDCTHSRGVELDDLQSPGHSMIL